MKNEPMIRLDQLNLTDETITIMQGIVAGYAKTPKDASPSIPLSQLVLWLGFDNQIRYRRALEQWNHQS